jgi:hypothetical protein
VAALIDELRRCAASLPGPAGPKRDCAYPYALLSYSANGVEESAIRVHALNVATLHDDLMNVTLLAFEDFLCSLALFRRFRTWCPDCLEG